MQLDPNERVTREIGQAAVGLTYDGGHLQQGADPADGVEYSNPHPAGPKSLKYQELTTRALAIAGAGSHTELHLETSASVRARGLRVFADLQVLNLADPLTNGIATTLHGHVPTSPSQVAITPDLSSELGVGIGGSLQIAAEPRTVTAIVQDPMSLKEAGVYVMPAGVPAGVHSSGDTRTILAATTHPVSWQQVRELNELGFAVTSREVIDHPPAGLPKFGTPGPLSTRDAVGVETVAVGLAILEVGLLAGAAFAVGARRQRRDLALVAAAGGDQRQVGAVVLAGGLVLGVVGSIIGAAASLGVARLALSSVSHNVGRSPGHFDVRPLELLAVMALGIVTSVLSSVLPARSAARADVVGALTGRRGAIGTPKRVSIGGVGMIVVGVVIAERATADFHFRVILVGAVLSELGFVVCSPAVVGAAGRLARFVPLSPRLALRDASRHRGRSGPAVAAIMAAVAGSIAVSTYFITTTDQDRDSYRPEARVGQPYLALGSVARPRLAAVMSVLRSDLGASRVAQVTTVNCVEVATHCWPLNVGVTRSQADDLAVGDASMLQLLSGRRNPAAAAALLAGKVVVFSQQPATLYRESSGDGGERSLPGLTEYVDDVGSKGSAVAGIISPAVAAGLRARTHGDDYIAVTAQAPTQQQIDRANDQLPRQAYLVVAGRFHRGDISIGLTVLAIVAAIVTLASTAVAVGLSMAESKPDLVTLAAVGAKPTVRRLLVASQAGTVALLGASLGVVAGVIPAWAVLHALRRGPFELPWTTVALVVLGVPLLAMLGSAAFAGSRLVVDRRAT
jgi:putative ABC transport system permease protein